MYNIEDIYSQALEDSSGYHSLNGSVINNGVKIQKWSDTNIQIMNCGRSGDYYQECNKEDYGMFFIYGWKKGGLRLSMINYKIKLDIIEYKGKLPLIDENNVVKISIYSFLLYLKLH